MSRSQHSTGPTLPLTRVAPYQHLGQELPEMPLAPPEVQAESVSTSDEELTLEPYWQMMDCQEVRRFKEELEMSQAANAQSNEDSESLTAKANDLQEELQNTRRQMAEELGALQSNNALQAQEVKTLKEELETLRLDRDQLKAHSDHRELQLSHQAEEIIKCQYVDHWQSEAAATIGRQTQDVLRRQDRLEEAEAMLKNLHILALQGDETRHRQAEAHLREVVSRCEQKLGPSHPETLAALGRLAFVLECNNPREAEQLNEQIWQRLDSLAPSEKRRGRARQGGFSLSLAAFGEPEKEETLMRQVVERLSSDTLSARTELANILACKEGPEAAKESLALLREVANLSETWLGREHDQTYAARAAHAAYVLKSLGLEDASAEDQYEDELATAKIREAFRLRGGESQWW